MPDNRKAAQRARQRADKERLLACRERRKQAQQQQQQHLPGGGGQQGGPRGSTPRCPACGVAHAEGGLPAAATGAPQPSPPGPREEWREPPGLAAAGGGASGSVPRGSMVRAGVGAAAAAAAAAGDGVAAVEEPAPGEGDELADAVAAVDDSPPSLMEWATDTDADSSTDTDDESSDMDTSSTDSEGEKALWLPRLAWLALLVVTPRWSLCRPSCAPPARVL